MGTTTFRGQRQPWERERTQSPPSARRSLHPHHRPGLQEPGDESGGWGAGRAVPVTGGEWGC